MFAASAKLTERRRSARFAIETEVSWRQLTRDARALAGQGTSINISSKGVLFTSAQKLPVGAYLHLSIAWPVELNGCTPLKLVATGRVVRTLPDCAAVRIMRYEFRTRARVPWLVERAS